METTGREFVERVYDEIAEAFDHPLLRLDEVPYRFLRDGEEERKCQ